MQMEPWRKRGFVPDSDSDDEVDSLNTGQTDVNDADGNNDDVDLNYIPVSASTLGLEPIYSGGNLHQQIEDETDTLALSGVRAARHESVELVSSPIAELTHWNELIRSNQAVGADESPLRSTSFDERTPRPRHGIKTYVKRSSERKMTNDDGKDNHVAPKQPSENIWDIPSSPMGRDRSARKSRHRQATSTLSRYTSDNPSPATKRTSVTKQPDYQRLSRSSSPDELNVVTFVPPTLPSHYAAESQTEDATRPEISDDSPLSSPPSSPLSASPYNQLKTNSNATIASQSDSLRQMLPIFEVSEDSTGRLSPPVRRSFRERNAIQLHPYALEMAKYQKQMREGGMRPIRTAMEAQRRNATETTDEGQGRDTFNPDADKSSPPPEEYLPPIREGPRRGGGAGGPEDRHSNRLRASFRRTESRKRRRTIHASKTKHRQNSVAHFRPQVVISASPTSNVNSNSVHNIQTSSPHSQSASSATPTPRISEGFRFPLGFTPPPTTTGADSKSISPMVDILDGEEPMDLDATSDEDSNSNSSQESNARLDETADERAIRRMQRQTRGVLPASWVRLNAQQRIEQQRAAHIKRNAASKRTDGKGVAKKIVRNSGQSKESTIGHRQALIDLGDSDESEEENENTNNQNFQHDDTDERLAEIVGFNNPFEQDGDIMEDNRIDYMLPTVSHNRLSLHSKRQRPKRPKPIESSASKERQAKRARLKRQTRITDASYGTRRTKQSAARSRSMPRLSILDAPDVVSRPRREQPQFLRIAARGVRSRQDAGRQSPTRKFLQLSSKLDTADANKSLQDWRKGTIQQTRIARFQKKPQKRQPLGKFADFGLRGTSIAHRSRTSGHFAAIEPTVVGSEEHSAKEHSTAGNNVLSPVPVAPSTAPDLRPSTQAEQRDNQWIVRRNLAVSTMQRSNARPAISTFAGPNEPRLASQVAFRQSLKLLNRDFRANHETLGAKPSLTLDRYISENVSSNASCDAPSRSSSKLLTSRSTGVRRQQGGRHSRKQTPKRIEIESDEYIQNHEEVPLILDDPGIISVTASAPNYTSAFGMGRLFNWQRSYSVDFGVAPLREGTFFHESTFIGSGEFSRSLHLLKRDLDQEAGLASIPVKNQIMHWGAWTEAASSELGSVFEMMIDDIEESTTSAETSSRFDLLSRTSTYRSIIGYVTDYLTFIDPIDRACFLSRTIGLVSKLRDTMASVMAGREYNAPGLVKFACYNLVLANQMHQIASHALVDSEFADGSLNLIKFSTKDVFELILSDAGISELQRLFEDNLRSELREKGIREEFPSAESYIVAKLLLHSSETFKGVFEDVQLEVFSRIALRTQNDVKGLERAWYGILNLLPLSELDSYGIARREFRLKGQNGNWDIVKKLLSPALDNYSTNSATQPISYNIYCRALFQRCHRLINVWGWRDCKPVLDTLYDFFAQNTLYNLKLEESRGSPSFLDELDQNPSLEIRPEEPCFHTLLKIIASGLRFLALRYNEKKVRNFAWRLLPNHGRVYPKENTLRHEDLDALRNHHDLLCTLYWVVPHGYRPRLEILRDLVNPATSHRETCNINLRSWTRLVRFKLSTNEDVQELEPFADWHSYFMTELRQQHWLARKEIEHQSKGDLGVSQQLIESTISQNQRQIESLLSMALSGMQTAIELAPTLEHAHRLVSKSPFESILGLFNPRLPRVNVVVSKALQVIVAYTRKDRVISPAANPVVPVVTPSAEDDSQEFESFDDWTELDAALVQQNPPSEAIEYVQRSLHPTVSRLVSNCFGEDHCPEDAILLNVVDCWTSIAQNLVRHAVKRWDNYLSPFGDESWTTLRETTQTRKFAPLFLAVCLEKDKQALLECRVQAMGMWISSLVERASMLKFQHRLTEALLNANSNDPLLQNLPFVKSKDNRYTITLEDLRNRRLSLISSLLSNMREHVLRIEMSSSGNFSVTKQEYSELLQRMMNAMKENYRELGNGAVESAQGAYVDFLHTVIRFLQEHTSDIRPVDAFFTDPALFPLPSTDPRYIVAKLKRYEPKLFSNKEVQTLAMFIQSILERATVERQQSHLVDQLHTAMKDTYEAGHTDKPTLRAVLLQCLFPAYLELAFSTSSAWVLSLPIIKSITLVFKDLLFKMDTTNSACVSSVLSIFDAVFQASYRAFSLLISHPIRLKDPTVLVTLLDFVEMISSSLVVVDYIDRVTATADQPISYIQWFRDFAVALASSLSTTNSNTPDNPSLKVLPAPKQSSDHSEYATSKHLATARRLAFDDHQSYLRNWSFRDGKYYYTRSGHEAKELALEPDVASIVGDETRAKAAFKQATQDLTGRIKKLQWFPN